MMQTVNIDAPPKGPIRWRWVTKAFASLLRAAGIISTDESVNIDATTGGFTLSQNAPATTDARIDIKSLGQDRYRVPVMSLFVPPVEFFEFEEQEVTIRQGEILCFRVSYMLGLFQDIDIDSVRLESVSVAQFESAETAKPTNETPVFGLIYVPLALRQNGLVVYPRIPYIGVEYVTLRYSM
jgi:hypothetical protein